MYMCVCIYVICVFMYLSIYVCVNVCSICIYLCIKWHERAFLFFKQIKDNKYYILIISYYITSLHYITELTEFSKKLQKAIHVQMTTPGKGTRDLSGPTGNNNIYI